MKTQGYLLILLLIGLLISCNPGARRLPQLKESFRGKTIINQNGSACTVKVDTIDQLTGARITELMPEHLFTYTHEPLREYFITQPLMVCNARLSRVGNSNYFLNLQFIIQASRVNINYQGLAKGSMLQLKLINGEHISLYCYENSPVTSATGNEKIFQGLYPISEKDLKKLRKYVLTDMGVHWNGGFEKYEIHIIDFFKTQYECLQKIR